MLPRSVLRCSVESLFCPAWASRKNPLVGKTTVMSLWTSVIRPLPVSSPYTYPPSADSVSERLVRDIQQTIRLEPNKKAFICADDPSNFVTFEDILHHGEAIASFLNSQGFSKQTACVVLPNCWHYAAFFLGVTIRGGTLSAASALFTDYELERQFVDSKATVVLTDVDHLERVRKAAANSPSVKTIVVIGATSRLPLGCLSWEEATAHSSDSFAKLTVPVDIHNDVAFLPYSSGTTGAPKGVMLTHSNMNSMADAYEVSCMGRLIRELFPDWDVRREVHLHFPPFYHVFGFQMMFYKLMAGTTSVVINKFSPDVFCRNIEQYKMRMASVVPPTLVMMTKSPICSKYDLSSLKFLMSGAAPAGKVLCDDIKKMYPNVKKVAQAYGMTEVSFASHFPDIVSLNKHACIGKVVAGLSAKIIDPEGNELPANEKGEMCVKGPTIMKGYLNREEATREALNDGWLRTGDIGYYDEDGDFFIVDRIKELIKVKGLQVPPAELEDLLLTHPSIKDAAVIGIPDSASGELPKAFVVASGNLTEKDVQTFVEQKVSHYKRLKGGVEFVREIPKSASGKILRRVLKDMHLSKVQGNQ